MKKNIVFGLFAYRTDGGTGEDRLRRRRPLLQLCSLPEFPVDTLYLFSHVGLDEHLKLLQKDLRQTAPGMRLEFLVGKKDAEDFSEYYLNFYSYFKAYEFDFTQCEYYLYFPPGIFPHVSLALMDVIRALWLPLKIVQIYPDAVDAVSGRDFSVFTLDVHSALRRHADHEKSLLSDLAYLKDGIRTRNAAFNELIARLEHVALNSRAPMLLSGESGVGKSRMVRRIYELKRRHGLLSGPLVELNCSVLRGDTAAAALFGHAKGAFTGAVSKRDGLLLRARNGLLFLDEVGELNLEAQAMLLKAVEEKTFLPLGSDTEVESDFQLICATNRDLAAEAEAGRFRSDLLARIDLWRFRLPELRRRPEDIPPNIAYELERLSRERNLNVHFAPGAEAHFLRFACSPDAVWPGNFRELSGMLERMAVFAPKGCISPEIVEREIAHAAAGWKKSGPPEAQSTPARSLLEQIMGPQRLAELDLFEQFHLAGVIAVCRESASPAEAGRRLYAVSRRNKRRQDDGNRLRNYLKSYGLCRQDIWGNGRA